MKTGDPVVSKAFPNKPLPAPITEGATYFVLLNGSGPDSFEITATPNTPNAPIPPIVTGPAPAAGTAPTLTPAMIVANPLMALDKG